MKKIFIILCIIAGLYTILNQNEETISLPTNTIRFRVIANSNQIEDQMTKMNLVTELYPTLMNATSTASSLPEARENLLNIQQDLHPIIKKYSTNYQLNYGNNYFPQKEYKGLTTAAGEYESLVITLDEGAGENWWCILFPPLCLLEGQEEEKDEVEYKLFVNEIIDKYKQ